MHIEQLAMLYLPDIAVGGIGNEGTVSPFTGQLYFAAGADEVSFWHHHRDIWAGVPALGQPIAAVLFAEGTAGTGGHDDDLPELTPRITGVS